jgi:hypothetical protein
MNGTNFRYTISPDGYLRLQKGDNAFKWTTVETYLQEIPYNPDRQLFRVIYRGSINLITITMSVAKTEYDLYLIDFVQPGEESSYLINISEL